MPIRITSTETSSMTYGSAFLGPVDHTVQVLIDLNSLTSAEIDEKGYLKPGVPFTKAGVRVTIGFVYGVTIEPIKVANDNLAPTIAALTDQWIGLGVIGMVIREAAETMLGRVYTAAEIAGFDAAGSKLVLIG